MNERPRSRSARPAPSARSARPGRPVAGAAVAVVAALGLTVTVGTHTAGAATHWTPGGGSATGHPHRALPPAFLAPAELPPHASSEWFAGPVTQGLPDPEPFCLEGGVLPGGAGTYHRFFHTDYDTHAAQVSVVTADADDARELAASLERTVANCAADWLRGNPGGTAAWDDYGTVAAGDGAHVYGVHTSVPDSEPGVNLFAVGRSGTTVTVVRWAEMGDLGQAPLTAFKATTKTAVGKLARTAE
ncbi:hypothetical protein [Streptomyces sp. NPDC093589]|uniref:hypothetical protein n=1 Tax=Streptomyces sp. NPDC093589 TaxID=3366043 RepID=UPI0037F516CA